MTWAEIIQKVSKVWTDDAPPQLHVLQTHALPCVQIIHTCIPITHTCITITHTTGSQSHSYTPIVLEHTCIAHTPMILRVCVSVCVRSLPMLILLGRFSLLAASTRCRRTSIMAAFCLLFNMASHSSRAGDELGEGGEWWLFFKSCGNKSYHL